MSIAIARQSQATVSQITSSLIDTNVSVEDRFAVLAKLIPTGIHAINNLNDKNRELASKISELSDKNDGLEEDLSDLSDKNGVLENRISELSDKNGALEVKISELEALNEADKVRRKQEMIDDASTKVQDLVRQKKPLCWGAAGIGTAGITSSVFIPILCVPTTLAMAGLLLKVDKLEEEKAALELFPEALKSNYVKKESIRILSLTQREKSVHNENEKRIRHLFSHEDGLDAADQEQVQLQEESARHNQELKSIELEVVKLRGWIQENMYK